jgi:hypothetical protein
MDDIDSAIFERQGRALEMTYDTLHATLVLQQALELLCPSLALLLIGIYNE